ncbi:hypothetical protein IB274_02345 [Pseudomonas sp. PDM18]|uniref:hypothetical protein n=1 Tax=Pseudomonas sp. PDM18 TaxID=2769253 RepID=UPI0017849E0D|nr:hypothetical protein [Pseudomonas sp. PDM18]MBD9675518.1 hypothetical protein [Pseudomonas sp. PDM18]
MSQLFINNFSVETLSTFAADEGYVLPLSGEAIAQLAALMYATDDYFILTVTAADQSSWEIIRYQPDNTVGQYPILRGYEGTVAKEWPAGSIISCNLTANTLLALTQGLGRTRGEEGQSLQPQTGGWVWAPQDEFPFLELNLNFLSGYIGSQPVDAFIELQSWDGASPTVLHVVGSGLRIKVPDGATAERDPDNTMYILTLPPTSAGYYRLRVQGLGMLTLEISDYSEYLSLDLT